MVQFKQYKAVSPEETITKIRMILDRIGIFLKENSYERDGLCACRLTIGNDGMSALDIGTNGKGRTYEFALASGYAEFMERLQNGIVYNRDKLDFIVKNILETHDETSPMKRLIKERNFQENIVTDVNESIWDMKTVTSVFCDDFRQLFHIDKDINVYNQVKDLIKDKQILMNSVYSVTDKKEILYPVKCALMATGSNGMCAGNTPVEAILQGICEIFERYSAFHIFFNNLTPPTLDPELFKDTVVFKKLKSLRKHRGYEFIIKDCSLGKGLPVIGLLIIDHDNNTYNFKLGADFVPSIALERCLTEVYQSRQGFIGLPLLDYGNSNDGEQYLKILKNGTGQWPESIFYAIPSYPFGGFCESLGKDDLIDLKYSCELISSLGSNLYIRNNSYFGFPSYYVIAPGLSGIWKDTAELYNNMQTDPTFITYKYKADFDFDKGLKDLIKDLEPYSNKKSEFSFNDLIPFYKSKELGDLDLNLFLCMAYYKIGDYQKSYDCMSNFLGGKGPEYKYYFAASEYILLRYLKKTNKDNVESFLVIKYGKKLAKSVIEDMCSPKDIFKYYNFSKHFDWRNMNINKNSHFFNVLALDRSIRNFMRNNPIKQEETGRLFGFENSLCN